MKIFLKILTITLISAVIVPIIAFFCIFICANGEIDESKLAKNTRTITIYDKNHEEIDGVFAFEKGDNIDIGELPDYVKNAFIAVEDKRFYRHKGIDYRAMARAFKNNLKSRSFKEGGSTITQQLIKNTQLTNEKTIKRKITEIKLAKKLEKTHSKEEILSYYLNGVYFGEGAYGIENAAKTYFNKSAKNLTLNEAASLAACVKAPAVYNPLQTKCMSRKNLVLQLMSEQGLISEKDYNENKDKQILCTFKRNNHYIPKVLDIAFDISQVSPYENLKLEINTYYDKLSQSILENDLKDVDGGGVIMTKDGKVKGYYMPQGELERSPASCIKPLLVYAPAIENKIVSLATPVLDEKCDFGDWSPKNYGDVYNGWVSVDEAIYKSLNVPAVKILQSLGIKKAAEYTKKMNIDLDENDLSAALGSLKNGVTLLDLCGGYTTFAGGGYYAKPRFISTIYKNGKLIYSDNSTAEKIFEKGTAELISIALADCAEKGTAKAIGKRDYTICAKTGTFGTQKGNTDALTVAYSSQDVIGVWLGKADNSLMDNKITGGIAARYVSGILNDLYRDNMPPDFTKSGEVKEVKLCKLALKKGELLKAVDNAPDKFTFFSPMLKTVAEKTATSDYYSPKLNNAKIKVNKNNVEIAAEKCGHVYFEVIETCGDGNEKIAETSEDSINISIEKDGLYNFSLIPFVLDREGNKIYGDMLNLPQIKITAENDFSNSDWWND